VSGAFFELSGETGRLRLLLADTWKSRSLLWMLARKDFFVRYRRASLGVFWAAGLPLLQLIVLAVVFSRVVRIHSQVNYVTLVFAGLVPWTFFSTALASASTAIVDGADLSTKVYFPRAVLPLVSVGSAAYGLGINVVLLVAVAAFEGVPIRASFLLLVPAAALVGLLTAAFALVLSALHVYFRDVRYVVQAAMAVWFYATPVFYPFRLAQSHGLAGLLSVNPMAGVVQVFRAAVTGTDGALGLPLWWTGGWIAALFLAAALLYRRYDRVFVDLL